jgi:hypothetical protein
MRAGIATYMLGPVPESESFDPRVQELGTDFNFPWNYPVVLRLEDLFYLGCSQLDTDQWSIHFCLQPSLSSPEVKCAVVK